MSKDTFPAIVYIKRESEGTQDEFFNVAEEYGRHAGTEEGETVVVAVYRLEKVRKLVTRHELCE